MFAAAIFDMDGLLLDSERVIMQAWMESAQEQGLPIMLCAPSASWRVLWPRLRHYD